MNWILFSFLGAIFQAIENAIKKKALQMQGMNNMVAVVAFLTAGLAFALIYFFQENTFTPKQALSGAFWNGTFWFVVLNVVAVWFGYKALDTAELTYLMPFMTLTSLSLIIPPMILLGEYPSIGSFAGILIVVIGALAMEWKKNKRLSLEELEKKKNNRRGLLYFLVTAVCYTFTPALAKIAVIESGNVLFASYVSHLLISLGFVLWIFLVASFEKRNSSLALIKQNLSGKGMRNFLIAAIPAGLAIAVANGSINYALQSATVANVFAIKRTMPLFAFVIGVLYFKERTNLMQKIVATIIMVVGAIIITVS